MFRLMCLVSPKKLKKLNDKLQTQSSIGGLLQQSGNMHAEDSIQAVEDGIAMFFAPKKHTWNGETASDEIKVETSRKRNEDPGSSGRSCHDISEPQNNLVETYKKTLFGAWIHSSKSHKSTAFRLRFFFCPSPRLHRRHPPRCSRQSSSRTHSWLRSWKLLELLLVLQKWWFLVPNGPNIPLELGLEVDLHLEKKPRLNATWLKFVSQDPKRTS